MHKVEPYKPKIKLISNGSPQEIYEYDDYEEFLYYIDLDFARSYIVNKFKKGTHIDNRPLSHYINHWSTGRWPIEIPWETPTYYIVRDEFGGMISVNEVFNDLRIKFKVKRATWARKFYLPYEYRKDPVPGTGKRTSYRNYWRHPRTTQELRRNSGEYNFTRGKRTKKYLPNAYWDIYRSEIFDRKSWKRNRKTQWK